MSSQKTVARQFNCAECGPAIGVDEDGCCVSCGTEATVGSKTTKTQSHMGTQADSTVAATALEVVADPHSPLPWHTGGKAGDRTGIWVEDTNGYEAPYRVAALVSHDDAEFIVRACNSHEDLLLALKNAREHMVACHARHGGTDWIYRLALVVIDTAISKAEGR